MERAMVHNLALIYHMIPRFILAVVLKRTLAKVVMVY
jgi:hypothetical protein